MLNRIRKLWHDDSGLGAIEFGVLAPFLLALLIGSLEVCFKIWSTQKAEKLAVTLSDVIAQSKSVTGDDLEKLIGASDKIMEPFPFGANGKVIISSVYREVGDEDPKVKWQCIFPPTGGYSATSNFGVKGEEPNLPADFEMKEKDNIIITEVFYEYEPFAPGVMFDKSEIYRLAMFAPRLGDLTTDPCE
ncbi:TadE/TadG family type IV pilus assembly protein [Dongia deserti]|uniref:TadE/TadG family type IV pilus assembly protein n=1 Tax=Dongia deserti TaxID=2268030 RepID=UPI000E654AEA|nr:TadE/TadG family type IV pilus assembly protein [Dongia deserti]